MCFCELPKMSISQYLDYTHNWQESRAKELSKFAVATLHASTLLSQQFRLTREQVQNTCHLHHYHQHFYHHHFALELISEQVVSQTWSRCFMALRGWS